MAGSKTDEAESKVFFADGLVDGADHAGTTTPLVRLLPALRIDVGDAAANDLLGLIFLGPPDLRKIHWAA